MLQGWQTVLGVDGTRLQNPHARLLYARIAGHLQHVLAWPPHLPGAPPHYAVHLETKTRFPGSLVAVRTKDHYAFVGVDAVIVCEKLDLKGEGVATRASDGCPEARVQAQNATGDFYRLCAEHKLDVVVCECRDANSKGRQERFVQQVCTPHSPHYHYGTAGVSEALDEDDISVLGARCELIAPETR